MPYYINDETVTLEAVKTRIQNTDLIPSRVSLLENIDDYFVTLKNQGILTLAQLRTAVKTAKKQNALSEETGIKSGYLNLLRREIEGYFPKAFPLKDFKWIDSVEIDRFIANGYKNTALLYEAVESSGKKAVFNYAEDRNALANELTALIGLTRIQWVSPLTAKMLFEAGYRDAASIVSAKAEALAAALARVNTENNFFEGTIGLRDIKRLIKAAGYV